MELSDFVFAAAAITFGSVVQTLSGVGGGFIIAPLLALIDLSLLPAPMVMASMSLSGIMSWRERSAIDYQLTPTILAGIIPGAIVGAYVLSQVSVERLGLVFGVVILLGVVITGLGLRVPAHRGSAALAGMTAGAMGSSTGIGAPILALLYQGASGPRVRSTLALLYTVASFLILIVLAAFGRFTEVEAISGLWLVPGFIIGYLLSQRLTARMNQKRTRWAVLAASGAAALVLIARSI
jgi:uncharacterized membrane protein YfcA